MPRFWFGKLVRDKIPERIRVKDEARVNSKKLVGAELVEVLKDKLVEEAGEVKTADVIVDEIADVYEVLDALKVAASLTDAQIEGIRNQKRKRSGGFAEGLYIEDIELDDDNPWNEKLRQEPDKYKEIT